MSTRRLNKSGSTSYTVSLPIEWIRANNLSAKDVLNVYPEGDSIRLTCKPQATKAKTSVLIDANKFTRRMLIELVRRQYHSDTTELAFVYRTTKDIEKISLVMDRFPGFEIHSQDEHRILYKYLFDQELIGEQQILRKMDLMIRTIVRELAETLENHGSYPDIAIPRRQIENLRKQAMLLERHSLRFRQVTVSRMNVLLAGRSLLKMGMLISDFFEILAVLDEGSILQFISPAVGQFHLLYDGATKAFFDNREEEAVALKERVLEQIDQVENAVLGADTVILAVGLTVIKNLLHEVARITELGALAKER